MPVGKSMRPALLGLAPLLLLQAGAVRAQSYQGQLRAGSLELPLNKSQVVSADRPIAKAMIGHAEVADVLPISDRSIYVLGKKMGTTSLTLYDSAGRVLSVMDVAVGPDVQSYRDQAAALLPGEQIDAHISGKAIVLTGLVSSAGAADRAVRLARTFIDDGEMGDKGDDKAKDDRVVNMLSLRGSQQVMLEVRFSEVNRSAGKDIGSSAFLSNRSGKFTGVVGTGARLVPETQTITTTVPGPNGSNITAQTTADVGVLKLASITNAFGILRGNFNIGGLNIDGLVNALEEKGLAKTLAEPTLIALSGEKASFLAGGEFPIPVVQSGNGGSGGNGQAITVEFKPFGVSLGFTPTVLGDKTINLLVEPEVSSIDPTASITLNGITIPGLQTRRASTTVELRDGESFAMAGLISRDFKTTIRQLPVLGSIPIIGTLFRSSQFQKGETELLIVVTPHLVQPIRPDQVRLPTDRVKDPTEVDTILMGDNYRARPVKPADAASAAPTGQGGAAPKQRDGYEY